MIIIMVINEITKICDFLQPAKYYFRGKINRGDICHGQSILCYYDDKLKVSLDKHLVLNKPVKHASTTRHPIVSSSSVKSSKCRYLI